MKLLGLKKIREEKKYTQLKVAFDLSMSREAISLYETGLRSPDVATLVRMSDYFDVSIDYLIRGEEFCPRIRRGKESKADE